MANNPFTIVVSAIINKQSYVQLASELKKFGKSINIPIDIDTSKLNSFLKSITVITNEQGSMVKNIQTYNAGLGKTITLTEALNKKTGELESKTKTHVDQEKINKAIEKQIALEKQVELQTNKINVSGYYNTQNRLIEESNNKRKEQLDILRKEAAEKVALSKNRVEQQAVADLEAKNKALDSSRQKTQAYYSQQQRFQQQDIDKRKEQLAALKNQTKASVDSLNKIKGSTQTLASQMNTALSKTIIWASAMTLFYGSLRQLQAGIKYIFELDNALNQIRIVTGASQEKVDSLAKSYNQLAQQMSVTTTEVAKQAVELYRQGLSQGDVNERMQAIIKYAKISGLEMQEANEIITASVNGTKADVNELIDVFSYLGDATATGADEIGRAFQKSASVAAVAGVDYKKLASYIAVVSSVTRNSAETIGNSMKSLMSRYQQIKEKGFNSEDAVNLNQVVKALDDVGITATDSTGQLRNYTDVLDELSKIWETLLPNQRSYIQTTMAG